MGKEYVTIDADTFDKIAYLFYGDSSLFSKIIEANPKYSGYVIFEAGVRLIIPESTQIYSEIVPPWRL